MSIGSKGYVLRVTKSTKMLTRLSILFCLTIINPNPILRISGNMPAPFPNPTMHKEKQQPKQVIIETATQSLGTAGLVSIQSCVYFQAMAAAPARLLLLLVLFMLSMSKLAFSLSESEALIEFKKSLVHNGALDSWNPDPMSNPCADQWKGVMCINEAVSSLFLQNMSLSGTINIDALSEIPGLAHIAFQDNFFTGPIPEFNKLGALNALYLSRNNFSEEIPEDFFSRMTPLQKLWIDNNKFTGKIPDSVMNLPNLTELHLEGNKFSGLIPESKQPISVTSLDLSRNNLEGEIPEGLSKYSPASFGENDKLCGKPLLQHCGKPTETSIAPPIQHPEGGTGKYYKLVIVVVLIVLLIMFIMVIVIFIKRRKERAYFSVIEKDHNRHDHNNRVVEVRVSESTNSNRKNMDLSSRKSNLSRKSSRGGRGSSGGMGDLVMINDEKAPFGLPDLMKAGAEVLGNGSLGSAYKAAMANGLTVVVKRIREMNKMGRDTFDNEMRRLGNIKHPNILPPLAYHYRRGEKLLVFEFMPNGSLLYLLHGDRRNSHAALNWPIRLKIIQGIASGMSFIHSEFKSYELPHGNLKSNNVLLNQHYEPLLTDYAFHPLTNPDHAEQTMFAYKSPEYTQFKQLSPKSDVYCLGIIILEIITGKYPSQYLSNAKGGVDVVELVRSLIGDPDRERELIDPDILVNEGNSVGVVMQLLQIGLDCTESETEKRLDMGEAIRRIQEIHD